MADSPYRAAEFFVSAGEATEGPYDLQTLRQRIAHGLITSKYQVWDEAKGGWAPFSTIEPLLKAAPAPPTPAAEPPGKKPPVRVKRPPPTILPGQPPLEGTVTAAKAPKFDPSGPRKSVGEAASLGAYVPRQVQRAAGTGTFEQEARQDGGADDDDDFEEESKPRKPPVESEAPRKRIYSPQTTRPFVASTLLTAAQTEPVEEAAPEVAWDAPRSTAADAGPASGSSSVIAPVIVTLLVCALIFGGLWTAGIVRIGAIKSASGLAAELAEEQKKVEAKDKELRKVLAEQQDYLSRFTAAQELVKQVRISVFTSTRRALEMGDRNAVDQRLFELDQLSKLVPYDEKEAQVYKELTDQYFSGAKPSQEAVPKAP